MQLRRFGRRRITISYWGRLAFFLAFFLLLLCGCISTQAGNGGEQKKLLEAKITEVIDGDTLKARIGNRQETVRLLLVDTPETKHPQKPVQPFGREAFEFTKKTLEGKQVELELDVSERDKYGRLLAYLWLGDTLFNETLLEKGLARVAVYPPNVKYADSFRETEKKAKQEGIGIWSVENYIRDSTGNDSGGGSTANDNSGYASCKEAIAAGAAPLRKGDPGYSRKLDRDGDGVACE